MSLAEQMNGTEPGTNSDLSLQSRVSLTDFIETTLNDVGLAGLGLPKADPSPSRDAWVAVEPLRHIQLFSVISVSVTIDKLDRLIYHFILLFHLNL